MTDTLRQLLTGLRALAVFTVVLGIAYPVAVWGIGRVAFPAQTDGSLVTQHGVVVGSRSLGQTFDGPRWFAGRASAGDHDALVSGGTNLGPSDGDLVASIESSRRELAERNQVPPADVPADALTASASGLDPYIYPAYAQIQVRRVATARGLAPEEVTGLVAAHTEGRTLGFLGEPRVNVLELNLDLEATR